jgi:hypothetical protein
MTDTSISAAVEQLKAYEAKSGKLPAKAVVTEKFGTSLSSVAIVHDPNARAPQGALGALLGMPFYVSKMLPQGVQAMFLNHENMPVGMIVDETYVPPAPIEPPNLDEAIKNMPREY